MKTLVINYKAYHAAFDERGRKIAELASNLSRKGKLDMIVAVPATKLKDISEINDRTFAQHTDNFDGGGHTGNITVHEVAMSGAVGSVLNHSEKYIGVNQASSTVEMLRLKSLESIVCVENVLTAKNMLGERGKFRRCRPEYVVFEPRDLIGGDIAVSVAMSKPVREFVEIVKKAGITPIIGGGINTGLDVSRGLVLGVEGIMVSSAVMLSNNYVEKINELADALLRKIETD